MNMGCISDRQVSEVHVSADQAPFRIRVIESSIDIGIVAIRWQAFGKLKSSLPSMPQFHRTLILTGTL